MKIRILPAVCIPLLLQLGGCNPGSGTTAAVVKPDSSQTTTPASGETPAAPAEDKQPAGAEPDC